MYRGLSQEQKEECFRNWIVEQNYKIELLSAYGYTRAECIEMLILQALQTMGH